MRIILIASILIVFLFIAGCTQTQPEVKSKNITVCFVATSAGPYLKNISASQYMSGGYGDAYGFLLQGIKAQNTNYTVKVLEDYYNLSGCNLFVAARFDEEQSTADAIRNFVCSGAKVFVLWPGDAELVNEFGMSMTDTTGLSIITSYSQHFAAKDISKVYIPGFQGFSGGTAVVTKGGSAVIAEKSCNKGTIVLSASNSFDNNHITKFDNAKLALNIVKYLANDSTQVSIPSFTAPEDEIAAYYNSIGSVGDAVKTISQMQDAEGKVVLAWWDYGTTIQSHNLKAIANSASPSSLAILSSFADIPASLQYQIASELGYKFSSDDTINDLSILHATTNDTKALDIIQRNNASYLLFSSDLEEKFGAVAYQYCYFKNETDKNSIGGSNCEKNLRMEIVQVRTQFKDEDFCNISLTGGKILVKAYSLYYFSSENYYCSDIDPDTNSLVLYNKNGTKLDTLKVQPTVSYDSNYYYFNVLYPSLSPNRKGDYYNTIFYRGLYETLPASFNATLVYNKTIDGMLTKVYKIN